jgi:uncharacterized protein (TIGR02266 family)
MSALRSRDELEAPVGRARHLSRQHRRVVVRCGCWLDHASATVFGSTVDLGHGGLFLRTALPMPEGADVRVTLRLPGVPDAVVAQAKVVHRVAAEHGDRPGLGVRFVAVERGRALLEGFLDGAVPTDLDIPDVG